MEELFMIPGRKREFFEGYDITYKKSVSLTPPQLFPQERDWSCAVACIRTMLSGLCENVADETSLIQTYCLTPGPHYSKDIKRYGLLDDYDAVYGCDAEQPDFSVVLKLMEEGYYVMLESMINYAHWMVLLGYYMIERPDTYAGEDCRLLFYDPYYNEVRLVNYDEFLSMWIDGNYAATKVARDFIAVKNKK